MTADPNFICSKKIGKAVCQKLVPRKCSAYTLGLRFQINLMRCFGYMDECACKRNTIMNAYKLMQIRNEMEFGTVKQVDQKSSRAVLL